MSLRLIGYFPSWGIHAMHYNVADIPADRLHYVIYAFANITANGDCVSSNAADDKVNFPQLLGMKKQYPAVQTFISVGGSSNSSNFSAATANPTILLHFAQSCVQFMKTNGFDGIDIDWEFPTAAQSQVFTNLLTELRRELDAQGATDKRKYLLTVAAPAGSSNYSNLQLPQIAAVVDWLNLMAYDFTVVSSASTDLVAPLMPYDSSFAKHAADNVDAAVQAYLKAGVSTDKLILGTRFVGTGWQGVGTANNGLYQPAKGAAKGTWDAAGVAPTGSFGYQDIKQNYLPSYSRFWQPDAQVPWLFNPSTGIFISYEDTQSITQKAKYAVAHQLGGVMIWQLAADDAQKTLVTALSGVITPVTSTSTLVQGQVVFDNGLPPASSLALRIYSLGFAGADALLGQGETDNLGNYSIPYSPQSAPVNLQVRAVDAQGNETTLSSTKYNAASKETLNLVAPSTLQPLASEFDRLSADMSKAIGGVANLSDAQEGPTRQDLTLLNESTSWDARILAIGARAAQQATATGLGHDVLYALFRVGLPSDPDLLATVPSTTVQTALTKASQAGIVSLSAEQITAATASFQNFATKTLVGLKAPGAVSSFQDLLTPVFANNPTQLTAFANLYFTQPLAGADLWTQAANTLKLPEATIDSLKLQGKFLFLTFNNAALSSNLQQQIGSAANLSQLAAKDYHKPATWQTTLTTLAGTGGDTALNDLIPPIYTGSTTQLRLAAYTGDLARKVRLSFPNETVARMVESKDLAVNPSTAGPVATFLRAASAVGYNLGRTPLNAFLAKSASSLPALDDASKQSLKTLHRLFQITPSTESLQAALSLGFTSAHDIAAAYTKDGFIDKYGTAFPPDEATIIYWRSQTVISVTFNFFSMAKGLDNSAPVYSLSASPTDRQNAKGAIVQQFPSMASLFGNLDFCQCDDCRSVLSPAAYFVDVLDFLNNSAANQAGFSPLDVLIGSTSKALPGRRPDLGALPLTCENTNTAMPYIDLVNEILEYYIANSHLDANAAYDTGSATTADLTAEPQHILPQVYTTTLKQAVYPLNLPFDLWIETVRGFLNYFKLSLAQVLDVLRPADTLELFTSVPATAYYRAQILSESLNISPAEYNLFTSLNTTNWFNLYGTYANESAALSDLKSAKTLSQHLGISYQDLVNLMGTGFLNPALYPLIFQFERFGIDMSDAFSYTGQPGYPPLANVPPGQAKTDFENLLASITTQYKSINPAFDAKTWLTTVLPANYSKRVLVLLDPDNGCNFTGTTLQYADNATAAAPLDLVKFNLFVRLWQKLGWSIDEIDRALQTFFPSNLPAWTDPGFPAAFDAAWKTALVYLAHLDDLNTRLAPALGRIALLPIWSNLQTQGEDPLYSQLFLTASVLNNDPDFDDPNGQFPGLPADQLANHQSAIQGALSLLPADVSAILSDAAVASPALFSLTNLSICYRYSLFAQCFQLSVSDLIALKALSGLNPFQALAATPLSVLKDDILLNQTLAFAQQMAVVQNSGFTVEDLQYLLRHQFDPVGKYQTDPNALIALVQTTAAGIQQIQAQNTVPANLLSLPETLIDQTLSGLFPAAILKALFAQLTNAQTYSASANSSTAIDPTPFVNETELTFAYDSVMQIQTVNYPGYLLNWKKTLLEAIAPAAATAALFNSLLDSIQSSVLTSLDKSMGDILGVYSSLIQYQAVPPPAATQNNLVGTLLAMWANNQTYVASQTAVAPANAINASSFFAGLSQAQQAGQITDPVPAIQFSYDSANQIQTLTCTGVLTDATRLKLASLPPAPAVLGTLLQNVRNQALAVFQNIATNLITPGPTDLDSYSKPFLGADSSSLQRIAKAQLINVFLPLLSQKLSRQLVIQTLTAELAADPLLTDALVTNASLLTDPSNAGKSLLGSFLGVALPGVSATYYTSPDETGAPASTGTASATDTADPSNTGGISTASCHFEGYLQVPTDGPYRFFAELGNLNAQVTFQLDSPNPTALFPTPAIKQTAAKDGDEASQFVQLQGGVAYHFTLDFQHLGAKGASFLIQGENLPKGPLSQILLYAESAISAFNRANILLSKVLQILQVTGLGLREVSYLTANAANFSNLNFSALPTQASDDSPAKAVALFTQFLTLADYADLRKGPAGATDGLIDVFQAASQSAPPNPPATLLANLTRRNPQVVHDTAGALGSAPHFLNNVGIRRIWEALQLVQTVSLSVKSLAASTQIVAANPTAPDAIAANFKNAVKAQYTPDQWRPIAQSVFDPLRKRKRDALVSYLVNSLQLQNSNQLFEFFLVDPGMEPVVQTSRLRLAMSSVQTFVQRCFLNLENANTNPSQNVSASNLNADWWEWMKRYRVWQANREIFLFPENWLEPELRLDKTDLFQALESELLQGDVTSDLVEDAFLTYLKGLDVRARLDIVATYLDQDLTTAASGAPLSSTLHVLGRTFGLPHKYFYRNYSSGTWTGWVAVTPDIESDHIVLAIWRGRLNVFWLTFITKVQSPSGSNAGSSDPVSSLNFGDLSGDIFSTKPQKQVHVQLHWSEYFQGQWSNRISSDLNKYPPISGLDDTFDVNRDIYVHVSKEIDSNGNEGAVKIHLDLNGYDSFFAFRVTSKNCAPDFDAAYWEPGLISPYNTPGVDATSYTGSTNLQCGFENDIQTSWPPSNVLTTTLSTENILDTLNNFSLLPCGNPVSPTPFIPSNDPFYTEAGGLVAPFFFKDTTNLNAANQSAFQDERTFYVEPSLTETVTTDWYGWAIGPALPAQNWSDPNLLGSINVVAQAPVKAFNISPIDPVYSVFPIKNTNDWVTTPGIEVSYGGVSIGESGAAKATKAAASALTAITVDRIPIKIGTQGLLINQVRSNKAVQVQLDSAKSNLILQQKKS